MRVEAARVADTTGSFGSLKLGVRYTHCSHCQALKVLLAQIAQMQLLTRLIGQGANHVTIDGVQLLFDFANKYQYSPFDFASLNFPLCSARRLTSLF